MDFLNVGIIGLGRIGKLHAQHIQQWLPKLRVCAVADPQLDSAWLKAHSIAKAFSSPQEIIDDSEIDAVLICSPVETHVGLIKQAAGQGKHIFCEKPLSLNEQEIREALEAVEQAKVVCQIGFNRRFDPNFFQLKQDLDKGVIGKPYMVRITSRDPGLPPQSYLETSGGMMMDMTIHDFDMARYLIGAEIEQVYACGDALVDQRVKACQDIDTAVIQLQFSNGVLGIIDNCRQAAYGYDQRIEVLGEKGALFADNPLPTSLVKRNQEGQKEDALMPFFLERYQQSYVHELNSFYKSIVDKSSTYVDCQDALKALWLAQAAQTSLLEKAPIQVKSA